MTKATLPRGAIRKLFTTDLPLFRAHLLRLDPETRRSRFVGSVDDSYLAAHAERCLAAGATVIGYFADGALRGVAELQCFEADGEAQAEAAFSVEAEYRRQGVADALFQRLMTVARNRGVRRLTINCLANNSAMQALAAKYHAELSFDEGDSIGNIAAGRPTLFSLVDEAVEDARGFARAAILLQRRIWAPQGTA